jgi:hypothetical protein
MMTSQKIENITERIRKLGNFHDCRIENITIDLKADMVRFHLSNVLWGLHGTDGYAPGSGEIRFTDIGEVNIPELSIDDDYIFSIKIGGDDQTSQAKMVLGNGREIRITFQEMEVWKGEGRL